MASKSIFLRQVAVDLREHCADHLLFPRGGVAYPLELTQLDAAHLHEQLLQQNLLHLLKAKAALLLFAGNALQEWIERIQLGV